MVVREEYVAKIVAERLMRTFKVHRQTPDGNGIKPIDEKTLALWIADALRQAHTEEQRD